MESHFAYVHSTLTREIAVFEKVPKMSMRIIFLGTSGSVPTLKRSLPATVVQCPTEQWMFDCGENTQRQMMASKMSFHRKTKVFITHLHGDHVLGLPGCCRRWPYGPQRAASSLRPIGYQRFSGLLPTNAQVRVNLSCGD